MHKEHQEVLISVINTFLFSSLHTLHPYDANKKIKLVACIIRMQCVESQLKMNAPIAICMQTSTLHQSQFITKIHNFFSDHSFSPGIFYLHVVINKHAK